MTCVSRSLPVRYPGVVWTRSSLALSLLAAAGCGDSVQSASDDSAPVDHVFIRLPGEPGKPRVLIYTFENYWRHASNIDCMTALTTMHDTRGFTVLVTNHPDAINAETLAEVDVLAFCVTSGSGMSPQSKADLESWIRAGGGTVGFHSASFTEPDWPFYVDHLGTTFATHAPGLWPATVTVSATHPITVGLEAFAMTEEWYSFAQPPDMIPGAQVVLAVDEETFPADYPSDYKQGYHPIAWTNERFGGRMFYSAFGHRPETFASDPIAIEIVGRGIEWAARQR
jgi:uncharacterized protein